LSAFPRFPVFSSDSSLVIVQKSNGIAQVFEALTGRPMTAPLPHNGQVVHAAFSPDSHYVITASRDNTARVWEINRPSFAPWGTPRQWVNRVAYSADHTRFVMACAGGSAQLFETATGKPVGPPLQHGNSVLCAAFSTDGTLVATGSKDQTTRIWDSRTGLPISPPLLLETANGYNDKVIALCFSADGKGLAAAGLKVVQVWDVATHRPRTQPIQQSGIVESMAFNADGRQLVTACDDGTARVWDTETGRAVTPPLKHDHAVAHAGFSPDGRLVVTASFDQTARVWDVKTGEPITFPLRHGSAVRFAVLDSTGGLLTVTEDGVWAWGLAPDPRPVQDLALEANVLAGHEIDASGSLMPLTAGEIHEGWNRLSSASQTNRYAEGQSGPRELKPDDPAQTQLFHAFILRSAQPGESQKPIDVSAFRNRGLADDYVGLKGFNLSALPLGQQKVRGTEFEIGPGVIQLSSAALLTYGQHFPTNLSGIKVGRKCEVLHFLHGGHGVARDEYVASYVIHFTNGTSWEIPVLGQDLTTFRRKNDKGPASASRSVVAWTVPTPSGTSVRLYQTSWENPLPQVEIESIDIVSAMSWSAAYLVAITVE
jgi:hypothetical protein